MRYALLLVLGACMLNKQPADILRSVDNDTDGPNDIYCEPLNPDLQRCRIYTGKPYLCSVQSGRWSCVFDEKTYLREAGL